jgi:hypothetical protein
LFALVKALESETRYRKAPLIRVFYLHCVEGLTQGAVAKECRCSLALIKIRLQALEQKLGRKPAALRAYSPAFDRLKASLSDWRARHIDYQRAIDGSDSEEE